MIYKKNGETLQNSYNKSGQTLSAAYSANGVQVFPSSFNLKVMTYNAGEWYYGSGDNVPADKDSEYYALQNGMISQNNPDILCIQEYWKIFSKTGRTALSMLQQHFPYIYAQGGESGYMGRCVCSKYPISNYTVRTYTAESNRYFDSCTITVNGVPITVINTLLGLTQANRDSENAQLIAFLKNQTRFICFGDFNTAIVYETASTSNEEYINNVKPFIDEGFNSANFSDFGFLCTQVKNGGNRKLCLDNCYVSQNIEVENVYVDTTKLTDNIVDEVDHMPLIAELVVN